MPNQMDTSSAFETVARQLGEARQELSHLSMRIDRLEQTLAIWRSDAASAPKAAEPVFSPPVVTADQPPATPVIPQVPVTPPITATRPTGLAGLAGTINSPSARPTPPSPVIPQVTPSPTATPPASTPIPSPPPPPSPNRSVGDWENLIGGQWALWAGSLALFLSVACFLAYTWNSLSPVVRFALGIATGFALLGASAYSRPRSQRWFSEGLCGAGLAVLYLSIWAGAQRFHLLSFGISFTAMAGVTALGVYLAVRYNAQSLSTLATLGGFVTPLLLQGMNTNGTTLHSNGFSLLTYIAVLNAGLLAVSLFKRWNSLVWLSFHATIILTGFWMAGDYTPALRWPVFAYFTLYFLLYVGAACFHSLVRREETAQSDLLLLYATTSVYALAGFALLETALGSFPGTFPVGLAVFFGVVCSLTALLARPNKNLIYNTGALALLFATVAVPVQWQQGSLVIGWCLEAAVLLILGARLNAPLLLRAGQIVWGLSLLPQLWVLSDAPASPQLLFLNQRALPLAVSMLSTLLVVANGWSLRQSSGEKKTLTDELADMYAVYAVASGVWLIAQETCLWFSWNKFPGPASWQAGAAYVVAALLALYAVAGFALGRWKQDVALRYSSLTLLGLCTMIPVWAGLTLANSGWTPFWNLRSLSYFVIAVALVITGRLTVRTKDFPDQTMPGEVRFMVVGLFILIGVTVELYFGGAQWQLSPRGNWHAGAVLLIAMLWSGFGAAFWLCSRGAVLRTAAFVVSTAASILLLIVSLGYAELKFESFLNLRLVGFLVAALSLVFPGLLGKKAENEEEPTDILLAPGSSVSLVWACSLLLWGATQEAFNFGSLHRAALGSHWLTALFFFLSIFWSVSGAGLLAAGVRWRMPLFRYAGYTVLGLAVSLLGATALTATQYGWTPAGNARFAAFLVASAICGGGAWMLRRHSEILRPWEIFCLRYLAWAGGGVLLWGLTQETHETFYYFREALHGHWDRWAQMAMSLVWSLYGAALLILGINRAHQQMRLAALGLLAITASKVFVFDLSFLDGPARVLSLAGLGLSLIFISWLYGRFGSGVRAKSPSTSTNAGAGNGLETS